MSLSCTVLDMKFFSEYVEGYGKEWCKNRTAIYIGAYEGLEHEG